MQKVRVPTSSHPKHIPRTSYQILVSFFIIFLSCMYTVEKTDSDVYLLHIQQALMHTAIQLYTKVRGYNLDYRLRKMFDI